MGKRDLGWILFSVVLAAAAAVWAVAGNVIATGSWGLSFRQEGMPPIGPAGADQLAQYDAVYVGNGEEKVLYLTFDAGYENGYTAKILDVLKEQQVSAAFFLVGDYLERSPDLVLRMAQEGHIVGNHTSSHPDMSAITDPAAFAGELEGVEQLYRSITGRDLPRYYRPPQGIYSQENLQLAHTLGYRTVFWSLAYVDWNNDAQPTREEALGKLLPRLHNGAVILLHATSRTNAEILEEFILEAKARGYRFAPLGELYGEV